MIKKSVRAPSDSVYGLAQEVERLKQLVYDLAQDLNSLRDGHMKLLRLLKKELS